MSTIPELYRYPSDAMGAASYMATSNALAGTDAGLSLDYWLEATLIAESLGDVHHDQPAPRYFHGFPNLLQSYKDSARRRVLFCGGDLAKPDALDFNPEA